MIIKSISGFVYINGVAATEKQQIKPYDVIDTRQGKITFTDDTSIEAMSVRLVDLGLATIEEVIEEVKLVEPNPTPTKQEVQPTSTAKTK